RRELSWQFVLRATEQILARLANFYLAGLHRFGRVHALDTRVVDEGRFLDVALLDVPQKSAVLDAVLLGTAHEDEDVHQQGEENRQVDPQRKLRPAIRKTG